MKWPWQRRREWYDAPPGLADQFSELAAYNSRVAQGIIHRAEYDARMDDIQHKFSAWRREVEAARERNQ